MVLVNEAKAQATGVEAKAEFFGLEATPRDLTSLVQT
jgi:hypothetical protein